MHLCGWSNKGGWLGGERGGENGQKTREKRGERRGGEEREPVYVCGLREAPDNVYAMLLEP
jgi:hypothetical protein